MSLIHWWPLNGNLNDYGTNSITLTNYNCTINDSGKIGKCYKLDGYLYNDNFTDLSSGSFSITYWVKYISYPDWNEYIICINNSASDDYLIQIGIQGEGTADVIGHLCVDQIRSGVDLERNKWYHIAYVYDGTAGKLYVDGTLVKSYTGLFINRTAVHLTINGRYGYRPTTWGQSYLNDVRIYNHALSAKEVKEISKGLVLHYDFEDPYVEGTTNLCSSLTPSEYSGWGSITFIKLRDNAYRIKNASSATEYWDSWGYDVSAYVGQTITFSVTVKNMTTSDATTKWIAIGQANTSQYPNHLPSSGTGNYINYNYETANNKRISWTGTVQSPGRVLIEIWTSKESSVGYSQLDVINVQIELKDHATPYTPDTRAPGIIADCSGYGYNGTQNGDIQIISDSVSGQHSGNFNGSDTKITSLFTCSTFGNDFTISAWLKSNVNNGGYLTAIGNEVSNGGIVFGELTTTNRLQCYLSGTNGTDINICSYNSFAANTWYHVVYTVKNALSAPEANLYINGTLVSTKTGTAAFGEPASELLYIGCNKRYRFWNGPISDIKIFATALSAEDILAEYNRKAAIDRNGTLFAGELIEQNSNAKIATKKSQTIATEFNEGTDKVKIFGGYTELEYIESTGTQYINTGVSYDANNVYICKFLITNLQYPQANYSGIMGQDGKIQLAYQSTGYWDTGNGGSSILASTNTIYVGKVECSTQKLYIDNVHVATRASQRDTSTKVGILGYDSYRCYARVYSASIENNGTLVRDFVPVKRNKDNVVGMFDKVECKFYANAGSGSFVAGEEIGPLSMICANEYNEL